MTFYSPLVPDAGGGGQKLGWSDLVWACWLVWFFIPIYKTNQQDYIYHGQQWPKHPWGLQTIYGGSPQERQDHSSLP